LLPLGSTDSLGNFDGGNKTKTIANLDQKLRRIPSKTVLRLTRSPSLSAIAKAEGLSKQTVFRLKQDPQAALAALEAWGL